MIADLIFLIGRYAAIFGLACFLIFGLALLLFRQALARGGLVLNETGDEATGEVTRQGLELGETVHYLRARSYQGQTEDLAGLGARYRSWIIVPFYLGVWAFCFGMALMSLTFGFVLFNQPV